MRILVGLVCFAFLSGCVDQPQAKPKLYPGDTFYEKTSAGWVISCRERYRTGTGKAVGHNECSMLKKEGIGAISLSSGPSGRSLSRPASGDSDICHTGPRAHGVDGKSMIGLPYHRQVSDLSSGTTYYKEFMRPWPYCGVYSASVPLKGFSDAYAIFDRESKARGW